MRNPNDARSPAAIGLPAAPGRPFAFLAILLLLVPSALGAQESDARLQWELEKKSEFAAGALEWVIPLVGHNYAGDVSAGFVPAAVSGGGILGVIVGANMTKCVDTYGGEVCGPNPNGTVMALGWLAYLGGRVWGTMSALEVTREFNRDLANRLGVGLDDVDLVLAPSPQGGVSVGLSFPMGR